MSAHLVDTNGKPTFISVFSGTGGSSLGYQLAGFKELLAIDFDDHAVQCFKSNFPDVPIWKRSVVDVNGKEILDFCKLNPGDLDVLDGSPPCQGFSIAGNREVQDPRNDLFIHFVRLINELKPKVFVMENVPGMASGRMKGKFIEIMQTLKSTGYYVKAKIMNAKFYNVPQNRKRIIFIGCKNKTPIFPIPNSKIISAYSVLKNIPLLLAPPMKEKYQEIFQNIRPWKAIINSVPKDILKKHIPRMVNNKGYSFGGYGKRLDYSHPCPTITKTFIEFSEPFIHFSENRYLYISELCVLCSFPYDWKLGNNYIKAYARLGNSVMPKFMQAIAETIKRELL